MDFGGVALSNASLDDPKKRKKKKKAKKPKKEKSKGPKSKANEHRSSADLTEVRDANLFAAWLELRQREKTKRKKKPGDDAVPQTQSNDLKAPRRRRKLNTKRAGAPGERSAPDPLEAARPMASSTRKEKKQKKRVAFDLSPLLLEPEPVGGTLAARNVLRLRRSGTGDKPPFTAAFPAAGRRGKPAAEENGAGSQSTSEDINSQDLFITQKTFLDPSVDLCSGTSTEDAPGYAEDAPGPPGYTETQSHIASSSARERSPPEPRSYPAPSSRNRFCPDPQDPTQHRVSTAWSPRKRPSPNPHSVPTASRPGPSSRRHVSHASTQTENFFTFPLPAFSLRFRPPSPGAEQPVDLSLPGRSRLGRGEAVGGAPGDRRDAEPDPADPADPASGDDSHGRGKADLSQLKTVQTRLNESFFFKLKGEGESPKPASPLMRLADRKKP